MKVEPLKTLFFDLDGTLLGARKLPLRLNFIWETRHFLKTFAIDTFGSLGVIRTMRLAVETSDSQYTNLDRIQQALSAKLQISDERAKSITAGMTGIVFPKLEKFFFAIPEAVALLEWSKTRFAVVLATNPFWPEEIVKMRLGWGLIDHRVFNFITHAESMHAAKPTSSYYQELLAKTSSKHPAETLLIGDSMKKDFPATQLGIPVFIISKNKSLKILKSSGAPAWTGNYKVLQSFLEKRLERNKR